MEVSNHVPDNHVLCEVEGCGFLTCNPIQLREHTETTGHSCWHPGRIAIEEIHMFSIRNLAVALGEMLLEQTNSRFLALAVLEEVKIGITAGVIIGGRPVVVSVNSDIPTDAMSKAAQA